MSGTSNPWRETVLEDGGKVPYKAILMSSRELRTSRYLGMGIAEEYLI